MIKRELNKSRICLKNVFGLIITSLIMAFTFYFNVIFCAVHVDSAPQMTLGFAISWFFDTSMEFLIEGILAFMYRKTEDNVNPKL